MIVEMVCRDGTIVTWFISEGRGVRQLNTELKEGTCVITMLGGDFFTYTLNNPTMSIQKDSPIVKQYPDGRVREIYSDGEIRTAYPDGYIENLSPSCETLSSGYPEERMTIRHSDGTVEWRT